MCLELYKLVQGVAMEKYRNTFANLALPLFAMSEPMPSKARRCCYPLPCLSPQSEAGHVAYYGDSRAPLPLPKSALGQSWAPPNVRTGPNGNRLYAKGMAAVQGIVQGQLLSS